MKLSEIKWTMEHNEKCDGCGKKYKIVTKEPEDPADSAAVFIKCDSCDEYIRFEVGYL